MNVGHGKTRAAGVAPLAGLRVAYAAFEPFPNTKGSGTRINQLVTALAQAGASVTLITLPGGPERELPGAVDHRPLRLGEPNFLARALAFRDRVAREFVSARPDVVHFRGPFEGEAALAVAAARGLPTIYEVNGLPSVELPYHYREVGAAVGLLGALRALEERTLRSASAVVTQSQTTLAHLRRRGMHPMTPALVIPNGAELSLRGTTPAAADPPVVFYAGTLAAWQGVLELMMAVRRCRREREVELELAGSARRRWVRQVEHAAARLGLRGAVRVLGPLRQDELARRMAGASICAAPLRADARNLDQGSSPIKLFEYMAAGRAVLSTDLPCVREIVTHAETGWLTTSARPGAIAEGLLALLGDPALRGQLGERARAHVAAHATWAQRGATLVDAYTQWLAQPVTCPGVVAELGPSARARA